VVYFTYSALSSPPDKDSDEIVRLNKIIRALMNRAEKTMNVRGSAFGLFETAVRLEDKVRRRTAQLENALRENEQINRALQRAQKRMKVEIAERQRIEEALRKANEHLEQLSTTDPLTGLANRRRLMEALTAEWNRALRTHHSIGMAMIDIDYFKKYNDRYGHPAGDQCLRHVAMALKTAVRRTDIAARYGGEEFAVIFPNTDYATVYHVADRARMAVYSLKAPHADSDTGILTVSVGVAAIAPSTDTTIDQLIYLADTALYVAKREGRNQVRGRFLESSGSQSENITFRG